MSSKNPEKVDTPEQIAEKLEKVDLNAEKSEEEGETSTKQPKLTPEQKLAKLEKQIDDYVELFEDPGATFDDKLRELIKIPTEVEHFFQHSLLNRNRSNRLFSSIPAELFERVFDPHHEEYANARPILIHILGFLVQCTSPMVHRKFKPLMESVVAGVAPKNNKVKMSTTIYSDMSLIVGHWADQAGDGKCIYQLLRHITVFCAAQKAELDVAQFLLCIRTLIHRIFQVAPLEPSEQFDNRIWNVGILAVIRRLLQATENRISDDLRKVLWEVISSMTRIGGITWFSLDKSFCKLAIKMNFVELQMILRDVHNVDATQFCLHLRVLELYTNAIVNTEMFGEKGEEEIPKTVGDSTRYILSFWIDAYLEKVQLPLQFTLSVFHYAIFIFLHEDLVIQEERVKQNFGAAMLDTGFAILEEAKADDLRGDIGPLFMDLIERLHEFEYLSDPVPVFVIKYLDKIRMIGDYKEWKKRVVDCKECIMELRDRRDWYSPQTLQEAKDLLPRFTDPEKHELKKIFNIFDKLPSAK